MIHRLGIVAALFAAVVIVDTTCFVATKSTTADFFVTEAMIVHLSPAARILTEEFYSSRNFITFQIERLKTTLSLESTYPGNSGNTSSKRRQLQQMFVACESKTGKVVGFAEVDARPLGSNSDSNGVNRSYMYNLAVDKKWKRKGIASELIRVCEGYVSDVHELCAENRLYLRVRSCNHAAIALYRSLGYVEVDPLSISLTKEDINSNSLEDGELILLAKDLPYDSVCEID
jgi:ribosomal protein S18 acetylase RimI-like enzyme